MPKFLGEFEELILFAVLGLDEDAYGASIRREIEARTGRTVTAGSVYTVLDRLERRGLVTSFTGEPTPERGGRRKRHYRIEKRGAELLHTTFEAQQQMARGTAGRLAELLRGNG